MKGKTLLILAATIFSLSLKGQETGANPANPERFNKEKDLLLAHYDFKTDVDDLHSAAAFFTLLQHPGFSNIKHHAVAGTYGTQGGLYVPPDKLMQQAFGDNWSDAHKNREKAVRQVKELVNETLSNESDIWIAEGGQSDFSARLLKELKADHPQLKASEHFHIVQHSDWNEEVTSRESLRFVKEKADYNRIPDGNALDNGTPGFRTPYYTQWKPHVKNPEVTKVWTLAIDLANKYNGKEGRYNNEAIAAGGLDFSDFVEVCWMLQLENLRDTEDFFKHFTGSGPKAK